MRCARCGDTLRSRATFQFHASGGPIYKCVACAGAHGPMLKRSLLIALLIGMILIAINQGDVLLRGQWSSALLWKILLTYVVPFVVATSGALTTSRVAPAD